MFNMVENLLLKQICRWIHQIYAEIVFLSYLEFQFVRTFQYFCIGLAVIGFWWSTWLIVDQIELFDIKRNGLIFFAINYALMLISNITYVASRVLSSSILKPYETDLNSKDNQNSANILDKKLKMRKPIPIIVLMNLFKLPIYTLGIGIVLFWRNLFDSIRFSRETLEQEHGVNEYIFLAVYIFVGGVSLFITGDIHAIVICPATNVFYALDKLNDLDSLFHFNVLFSKKNKNGNSADGNTDNVEIHMNKETDEAKNPKDNIFTSDEKNDSSKYKQNNSDRLEKKFVISIGGRNEKLPEKSKNDSELCKHQIEDAAIAAEELPRVNTSRNKYSIKSSFHKKLLKYLLLLHYKYVLIHILAAFLWASVWHLYDYLLAEIGMSNTLLDVVGYLAVVIVLFLICHFLLLPLREQYQSKYIRALFNLVLGPATVIIWASSWYMYDTIAKEIGLWFVVTFYHSKSRNFIFGCKFLLACLLS